jgi:drug/metabolite transporter (DMT)-like permease
VAKNNTSALKLVGTAITWLAGLAAYLYVVGGLLMWVRLHEAKLPPMPVVSELPKTLLVSTALIGALGPALVFFALALVAIYLQTGVVPLFQALDKKRKGIKLSSHAIVGLLVLVVVVIAALLVGEHSNSTLAWSFAIAAVVTYVVAVFLASKIGDQPFNQLQTYVLVAALAGLVGASMRVWVDFRRSTLPNAVVCLNDNAGASYSGVLIGESTSTVYLGQKANGRLLVIPSSRVGELQVGAPDATACVPKK